MADQNCTLGQSGHSVSDRGADHVARERRVLLRHYLQQGLSKAEIARSLSRRTIYHWIETGQLERELNDGPARYGPRPSVPRLIDPYRGII